MFGDKINNVRIVPVTLKIVLVFTLFILISNFASNYINLTFNQTELLEKMSQLLTKDLKNLYSFCNNQYEIYQYDNDLEGSIKSIETKGAHELSNSKALFLGIKPEGRIQFQAGKKVNETPVVPQKEYFSDKEILDEMNQHHANNVDSGYIYFDYNDSDYYGIYKYNDKWDFYLIRAEELNEFYSESRSNFIKISLIIAGITIICAIVGIFILRFLLRYINVISSGIMKMLKTQELDIIDMSKATNDDISFLGMAFNSLSSTVDNLIYIFRKFANQDIVAKAYQEQEVRLEGEKKELTILFTDIKSFTFITETLGTDIIKLLNLHYDRAIREIVKYEGVIGSIIGDALLAVFGALGGTSNNKSYYAIQSAYRIQAVTQELRDRMAVTKDKIEHQKGGSLTEEEEKVYQAVLLEVGVGIDGGEVFYGTLGSYVRMTNTVIGDNVNAASRLEGLTRIYKIPVICSEFVKNDIEFNVENHGIYFLEVDMVKVKGKTTGTKVYWPILEKDITPAMKRKINAFAAGLAFYYEGKWGNAGQKFKASKLDPAEVFIERTKGKCPKNWKGIWEMTTK